MAKWADRAKKAVNQAPQSFAAKSLQKTIDEAKTVACDIRFIMESSGASVDQEINYDAQSMTVIEQFYRSHAKHPSSIELGIDNFERLLSLYLGQSLVSRGMGEWVQYNGSYHVMVPYVIQLNDGHYVDVFLFCMNLHHKQAVGSRSQQALIKFIERTHKMAFP